jgi:putative DNA primase/helicase
VEWRGEEIQDHHLSDIRLALEADGFEPNERDIRPAVECVARDESYNPIADYLNGLAWDGTSRLEEWMVKLLGAPQTDFVRLISPKVLIAAVARALRPGCKVDTVLILEGAQGIKKSTAIAALFGEAYATESVSLFDQHNKMVLAMRGSWVVELAEFVAIARRDHGAVKGMISMCSDKVVLPYAKYASNHPRRCVFFATVNPEGNGYLTDMTGNRRYWPVSVTKIELEGIRAARDQLWAEACHRFQVGERWWLEQHEEGVASSVQEDREEADAWAEALETKIIESGFEELTVDQALTLLGLGNERKDRRAQMRAADVLKKLGFTRKRSRHLSGDKKPRWVWSREQS